MAQMKNKLSNNLTCSTTSCSLFCTIYLVTLISIYYRYIYIYIYIYIMNTIIVVTYYNYGLDYLKHVRDLQFLGLNNCQKSTSFGNRGM